jgi:N-acetylneuraminate synthase
MTGRVYIIAEAGVNHDGSLDDALRLVDAAAAAGADCVKFQTFVASALASTRAEKAQYQKRTTDAEESQLAMLKRLELPPAAYRTLQDRARVRDIDFLSTPFDPASLDFLLHDLKLDRLKVGSGDMTNAPMLLEMARAGREVILSTGMATLDEVEEALSVLAFGYAGRREAPSRAAVAQAFGDPAVRAALIGKVTVLHCTTEYPAPPAAANLRAMDTLAEKFGLPVGYSDHSMGLEVTISAAARGAVMIEKHLTLDCGRDGPDHAASLEPETFGRMVAAIRLVEAALGDGRKAPQPAEAANIPIARKSLVAARAIAAGEAFTADNLALKRPATGLPPIALWDLLGKPARRAYAADEAIEP